MEHRRKKIGTQTKKNETQTNTDFADKHGLIIKIFLKLNN